MDSSIWVKKMDRRKFKHLNSHSKTFLDRLLNVQTKKNSTKESKRRELLNSELASQLHLSRKSVVKCPKANAETKLQLF